MPCQSSGMIDERPRYQTKEPALVALTMLLAMAGCGGQNGVEAMDGSAGRAIGGTMGGGTTGVGGGTTGIGGAGGHLTDLTASLEPRQLTAHFFHNQKYPTNTNTQSVRVDVGGRVDPIPQGPVYVRIVLDQPVFESNVHFSIASPNSVSLQFFPILDVSAGSYSGSIQLQAFQDAAFTKPYNVIGGDFTYQLTVDPELTFSVKIDGVLQSGTFTSSHFAVADYNPIGNGTIYWSGPTTPPAAFTFRPGQVVELEANIPVNWYGPDRSGGAYGYWFDPPTVTETSIIQTMPEPRQGSRLDGLSFIAMPVARGQFGSGFVFDLAAAVTGP